jgi:ubiquinone/menaquinone biosynthesis C-methylase UbiE
MISLYQKGNVKTAKNRQSKLNRWNQLRYSLHSLYYDRLVGFIEKIRSTAIEFLNPGDNDNILIIGAGTGLDLKYLRATQRIIAVDITPAMLMKLKKRNKKLQLNAQAIVMDAHHLTFQNEMFDCVILNFILSVIADPKQCFDEARRVLKPGGKILVFDKFLDDHEKPSFVRSVANKISAFLFSELTRRFSDIVAADKWKIEMRQPALFGGFFTIRVLMRKAP